MKIDLQSTMKINDITTTSDDNSYPTPEWSHEQHTTYHHHHHLHSLSGITALLWCSTVVARRSVSSFSPFSFVDFLVMKIWRTFLVFLGDFNGGRRCGGGLEISWFFGLKTTKQTWIERLLLLTGICGSERYIFCLFFLGLVLTGAFCGGWISCLYMRSRYMRMTRFRDFLFQALFSFDSSFVVLLWRT